MNAECQTTERRVFYRFEENDGMSVPTDTKPCGPDPVANPLAIGWKVSSKPTKQGFWRRQFGAEVTPAQRKFDWFVGLFLPLFCFYFDPIVFRSWWERDGMLHEFQIFAYVLGAVSNLGLAAWLLWGGWLKWLNGWLAGLFFSASVISLVVGVILFPLSMLGLMFAFIGLLGFSPLFASIVYARNGVRALRAASPDFERKTLVYVVSFSGLMCLVLPWVINQVFHIPAGRTINIW